jgi:hypothetical protein
MEKDGKYIYDEVLDEQDLLEEIVLQFADEKRYNCIVHLTSMEVKFEDKEKAITLLCSFPESWDNLVTSIRFSSIDILDYDFIVGALLAEEMRRKSS